MCAFCWKVKSDKTIPNQSVKRGIKGIKMDVLKRIADTAVVPAVTVDNAADAVPAARAMLSGGVDVMEFTFRTTAGADAIAAVAKEWPEALVGAGTVLTLEQCKKAVDCGAQFIISPGCSEEVVAWCERNHVVVIPGCATSTELMAALEHGVKVVKFFPAEGCGGLDAMRALSAPFGGMKFIPTGGVNEKNLGEYLAAPFVFAVGGSWLCTKADIAAHNFEKITALCTEARRTVLGFELAHIGINTRSKEEADSLCRMFEKAFQFPVDCGGGSCFAGAGIEAMYSTGIGEKGHIAIQTNSISRAAAELEKKGFALDQSTAKYWGETVVSVYLKQDFGGFAVHLLQKQGGFR